MARLLQLVVLIGYGCALAAQMIGCEEGFVRWANSYYRTWGNPAGVLDRASQLQLTLDSHSGSGFESISIYGSGSFNMKIKTTDNSTGVITSFYLTSRSSRHDELSFQLLGSNGPPYRLNTNMILYGEGGKDQRFRLWFDPSKDYHSYKLLWNPHQLVFYVDDTPIRVFEKNPEVYYPSIQTMFMMGSVKSEDGVIIDRKHAAYIVRFQASKIEGCVTTFFNIERCAGSEFWWNREEYRKLNIREQELYRNARKTYLDYDYCSDRQRYPREPPECRNYK